MLPVPTVQSAELCAPGTELMVPQSVTVVLQRHESETLKKVVSTWFDPKQWTELLALSAGQLTASDVTWHFLFRIAKHLLGSSLPCNF